MTRYDEGLIVLPIYLVVDTSASLASAIEGINAGVSDLIHSVAYDPTLADLVQVCLIQFSSSAKVAVPLSATYEIEEPIRLSAGGSTSYSAAFNLTRKTILSDIARLKDAAFKVLRPLMFFVTDGSPVDPSWRLAFEELRPPRFHSGPNIVAIGFGSVDPAIIQDIGRGKGGSFLISDAIGVKDAIESIWAEVASMISATAHSSIGTPMRDAPIQVPRQWRNLNSAKD